MCASLAGAAGAARAATTVAKFVLVSLARYADGVQGTSFLVSMFPKLVSAAHDIRWMPYRLVGASCTESSDVRLRSTDIPPARSPGGGVGRISQATRVHLTVLAGRTTMVCRT